MLHYSLFFFFCIFTSLFSSTAAFCALEKPLHQATKQKVKAKKIFRYASVGEPANLNPVTSIWYDDHWLHAISSSTLLISAPDTREPMPALAESWEVSDDKRIYKIHLRKNAKWSDGSPLTADDFVYTWVDLVLAPSALYQNSPLLSLCLRLKNGRNFHNGLKDRKSVGMKALDAHTLYFEFEGPNLTFLSDAAQSCATTLKRTSLEEEKKKNWFDIKNNLVNGPYKPVTWKIKDSMILEKNPYYWDKDQLDIDEIHFSLIENLNTQQKLFQAGLLDMTSEITSIQEVNRYLSYPDNGGLTFYEVISSSFIKLNLKLPFLGDVRVRKALSLMVDRKKISELSYRKKDAFHTPLRRFMPYALSKYYDPNIPLLSCSPSDKDIQIARNLIKEAGWGPGLKPIPPLHFSFSLSDFKKALAFSLKDSWSKVGVDLILDITEPKTVLQLGREIPFETAFIRLAYFEEEPIANAGLFRKDSILAPGINWYSPEYEKHLLLAEKATTLDQLRRHLQGAENVLMEEIPAIPIACLKDARLISKKIKRLVNGHLVPWVPANGRLDFDTIRLEP